MFGDSTGVMKKRARNFSIIVTAVIGAVLVLSPLLCWLLRPLLMAVAGSSEADYQAGKPVTHMIYWQAMQWCIIIACFGAGLLAMSRYLWHRRYRDAALLDAVKE